MKFSKNWINDYVSIHKKENIENLLTQLGLEVDDVKKLVKIILLISNSHLIGVTVYQSMEHLEI